MTSELDSAARAARQALTRSRRIVVKIGSRSLADPDSPFERLAAEIAALRGEGGKTRSSRGAPRRSVVLVSSGAIALGVERLHLGKRPRAMPALQAAAAAGQGMLMQAWAAAFAASGTTVAQVLLTHADLASRTRANNARAALASLLDLRAVPIINENDAVAVDEIRFGDNDELAAMVAPLCDADLLVLLSHVDGLYDEAGQRVPFVPRVSEARGLVSDAVSAQGRGGMRSKLEAARRATLAGVHVVIAPAHQPEVLRRIVAGDDVGTLLPALGTRLSTRKHWIAFTLRPRGAAIVDAGAAAAIRQRASVLCVGVVGVRGAFVSGDPISIVDREGREIARGLARLSSGDAARLAGTRGETDEPLVHRDDLVVLPEP